MIQDAMREEKNTVNSGQLSGYDNCNFSDYKVYDYKYAPQERVKIAH